MIEEKEEMTGVEISEEIVAIAEAAAVVDLTAAAVAADLVVKVVAAQADRGEGDKHNLVPPRRDANENSSLNMDGDYGPGRIATIKLSLRRTLHRSEQ